MSLVRFPYGDSFLSYDIPGSRLKGILVSRIHEYRPAAPPLELVRQALENPIASPRLRDLAKEAAAKGKNNVVLIASDHTRPVPSKVIIPPMLEEIRAGNPRADITILISTGCHRRTTRAELAAKFGEEIVNKERIVIHDCDSSPTVNLGALPSGGKLIVNKIAAGADLLCAEGFIEPHFFAGFSGGRKSVLPGIANRETVLYNHNGAFIASPAARTGVIDGNPIHADMIWAARQARLAFICNVVINAHKEAIYAVAGDAEEAHRQGREFLSAMCAVEPSGLADIVITTNGGYPLDQNVYQSVKGMTAAEAAVKEGGVIIMASESRDGHGGESFFNTFKNEKNLARMIKIFAETPKEKTIVDQWESQILARVLLKAKVIYISSLDDELVKEFQMIPARSLEEAVTKAEEICNNKNAAITAIPDGIAVIVR